MLAAIGKPQTISKNWHDDRLAFTPTQSGMIHLRREPRITLAARRTTAMMEPRSVAEQNTIRLGRSWNGSTPILRDAPPSWSGCELRDSRAKEVVYRSTACQIRLHDLFTHRYTARHIPMAPPC
jgi:hypothetical protein